MAFIQLQTHVGYGLVGGRPVFLDLERDRYLALPPPVERVFTQLCALDEPVMPEGSERDLLLGTGLFRTGSLRGHGVQPTFVPRCSASLRDDPARPRGGLRAFLAARASVRRAARQLASQPLRAIASAIRENRYAAPPPEDGTVIEDATRQFLAARALVPVEARCLLDCLALLDWLGDDAKPAMLVFGVRQDPFAAHCWLQTDTLLLTDAADELGTFTPVFRV